MNRRQFTRLAGGAIAVPILTGCTLLDARDEDRATVSIGDDVFQPGGITVNVGDTVVWRNHDTRPHRVSTDPADFDGDTPVSVPDGAQVFSSEEILPNERFTHTFEISGDYIYACPINPIMIGTITVQ